MTLKRSLKVIQTGTMGAVSYSPSIVTTALSCVSSEKKIVIFSYPLVFGAPVRGGGPRRNISIPFCMEKLEWWGYATVKKLEDVYDRSDSIPACDKRTSCHGIVRTMHTRCAVKTWLFVVPEG